jgi:spore germination cell wall hydrolase CwlJ-like protein
MAWKAAAILLVVGGLSACAARYVTTGSGREAGLARITASFTDAGLRRYVADMNPAMLALAKRHDPRPHKDYWGRVPGWEVIRLKDIPRLGDRAADFDEARTINALRPAIVEIEAAKPFVLTGTGDARAKALNCLTQAVYYEAGFRAGRGPAGRGPDGDQPDAPPRLSEVDLRRDLRGRGALDRLPVQLRLRRLLGPHAFAGDLGQRPGRGAAGPERLRVQAGRHRHPLSRRLCRALLGADLVKLRQFGQHIFYRWTGPSGC